MLELVDQVGRSSNVGVLIAAGESDTMEFKSSLHHPYGPMPDDLLFRVQAGKLNEHQAWKEVHKQLNQSVTKTLAAFLNSAGGTLLIGVDDTGAVLGIEADFAHVQPDKQNQDGWLLSLREAINNALGDEVWGVLHVSLVPHEQSVVAVIQCPARSSTAAGSSTACRYSGHQTTRRSSGGHATIASGRCPSELAG